MYLQAILAEKYTLKYKETWQSNMDMKTWSQIWNSRNWSKNRIRLETQNQKEELCEGLLGKKYKNRAKDTEGPHIVCTQRIWHKTGLLESQLTEHMPQFKHSTLGKPEANLKSNLEPKLVPAWPSPEPRRASVQNQ
jgi:hypothetical protein